MRNLSTEFKEQQNSGNRNYLKYADFTFTDGSTLSITDKDLWSNGFNFEDAVSQSGSFDIGAAIVNKLTLQINNFSGKYTDYIWDGARVVCYIGLELSTGIEKIRICTMTVTDAPYQSTAIISLTCEDSMRLFDRDYSESKLTYPATRLQIIQDACEVCGVTLQSTRFDNDDFVIQNRPDDSSITFRQVIAWVAQMGCQWAKCDEYGRLCFGWYEREVPDNFYDLVETPWKDVEGNDILDTTGEQIITIMQTGITAIQTNGFTPWLYDLEITGIKVTEYVENSSQNEAKTYQSGKSGYVIEISDNKLIQEGTGEEICKIISDRCVGMKFRPFSTGALTNIAWEAGDTIAISDRNGKQYKSYLTSVTLNPGAFEQLECSAKSASRNKQKQYSLNQQIQAENNKNLRDERTAREKAIEELSQRLSESSGTYTTVETQPDGSNIYYLHNKPQLSDSDIVWKMTAEAWAVSTDGGQHWNGGMTVDGDVIARILTATGVNADWINTGTIKAIDKDGNTTFLVDVTTGRVVINADSVQIKGKDVNAIAKEKAEKEVNNFISNTYTTDINNLQSQIDGQIETFFYDYEPTLQNIPASGWTTNEERKKHEGDLFYWKSKGYAYRFMQDGATWKWQLVQDTDITLALAAAEKAQDTADHKRRVFVVQPKPPYDIGDLWTQGSNGDLMRCKVARASGSYSVDDWEKASKYTDDSSLDLFINGVFKDSLNSLKTQIDGKIETWYQPNDPSVKWTKTEEYPWRDIDGNKILDESGNEIVLVWESEKVEHEGDLWHNTTDNTQWIYKSGIWQPQSIPNELLDKIDGKSSVYMIQPTPPYYEGDLWVTTNSEGKASLKTSFVNRINGDFTASDWIDFKYADKDDIKNAIDNYDTSLGQDEVFNKLTKGGTEQGIYIEDGKVYINAKYILAGLLAGERINGRGLKVINDDKNVTLEIDSKGNVILAPKTFSLQGKTVKEIADSSASTAVSGQTQADIFNKLTNGGKAQGIYLDENGNVYVNGEYVQAKGIKVVDSNGKTTFAIDKTTGAVTIAASQFTLGDKSVTDIAQEEAIKQVQDITSDNIIKGYYLTEQNVKDYWSTQSAYTYEYGVQDVDGGKNAIKINGTGAQFGTKNYKPIKVTGNYTFSFWIKTSVATQVYVYLGSKTILNAKTTTEWQRLQVTTTLSSLPNDSLNSLRILTSSVGSSVKYDTYIYMPKLEYAYTNEQVFNMLTNNGAIKGMYMENGELYFSFTYAHGGTLKLGGSNNGNGLLSILNASGTQVGYIDNTGVHFNQGEFSGSVKSLTGEIGNWQIDKTNGKLTSANGAIVLDAKNNMVTINGVDLKANGNGFVIDGGVKIKNSPKSSEFGDESNFFCIENLGSITDGTHLGVNSQGMVIKVPSSSWRYKSIRTTVKEEELEELYRVKVVWAKYKEGYLDKNDSRYDKLMPMFLAEDMERRFPIAVNHLPDGKPEDWNYRIMIPSMFAMIKFNHEKIKKLKSENEELKSELKSIKEELAEIKQLLGKSI
nr:MAG TPA: Putative tail protein [Caudoviricetes sp.]